MLFSTWWIFITILTAFYTANLTAFLTLSKFTLPISEPKDIGTKHYKWVSNKGNAIEDSLSTEKDNINVDPGRTLVSEIGHAFSYPDIDDNLILKEYVEKKNVMFIRERPIADYILYHDYKTKARAGKKEEDRCTFVITKFAVTSYKRAFAYSRKFKYKPLFDLA